ncbi:hypothetical protein HOL21_00110 [Candidatus Woesearchaeota archaeon]|jgi:hypothetical protein|nr:hypothetical protein [Candidatus Woesearchaeota archaeon]MBT5396603.1 hypothetical protein [Candidatus Woesearchaeota archaeon]MBT6367997.1 hypothetical protein [Candidatus Woesearchaeota archaeon]MBT7762231.1 hypothetical protein [Candidatus Woesearchaeota archaeon]
MFRLFFTPEWFNGWDIVFNVVSLLIAFLIAGYSWRIYRVNKDTKYAYFSLAFILVFVGLLFKSFTSGVLYFFPVREVVADVLRPVAGQSLQLSELFYRGAFFVQMMAMLSAWLLIFFISQKSRARLSKFYEVSQIGLFIYLVLLISIVSNFQYTVFYLTSAVLLSLIVLNYYKSYLNSGNKNTKKIMQAFMLILMGNVFFIFVFLFQSFYAVGEILVLLGFLFLLYTYNKVKRR